MSPDRVRRLRPIARQLRRFRAAVLACGAPGVRLSVRRYGQQMTVHAQPRWRRIEIEIDGRTIRPQPADVHVWGCTLEWLEHTSPAKVGQYVGRCLVERVLEQYPPELRMRLAAAEAQAEASTFVRLPQR